MKLQNDVYIDEKTHTYWHVSTKRQYVSASKFLDHFEEKEDWSAIALNCSRSKKGKYKGKSQAEILKMWDDNRDSSAKHGTLIHSVLENYSKYFKIEPEYEYLRPMVESIHAEKTGYIRKYQEVILYIDFKSQTGKYAGVAGTVDEIMLVDKKLLASIEDYKTNKSKPISMYHEKGKTKKFPINHLQDCSYVRYSLQMSIYSLMYESITGGTIRDLNIRYIPPHDYLAHYKIPCGYYKSDVINMLNYFELNYNESKFDKPMVVTNVTESTFTVGDTYVLEIL